MADFESWVEFSNAVMSILPHADIDFTFDGNIIIYTNLMVSDEGTIIPWTDVSADPQD